MHEKIENKKLKNVFHLKRQEFTFFLTSKWLDKCESSSVFFLIESLPVFHLIVCFGVVRKYAY